MYSFEFTKKFLPWLNETKDGSFKSAIERGLKVDAPEDAKKAYEEFLRLEEDALKTYSRY